MKQGVATGTVVRVPRGALRARAKAARKRQRRKTARYDAIAVRVYVPTVVRRRAGRDDVLFVYPDRAADPTVGAG
jgi:hypothetical protein